MEESVTRKFVHEESSTITSLCGKNLLECRGHNIDGFMDVETMWPKQMLFVLNMKMNIYASCFP